ncbi:CotO family spore coat protein [Virgibacillus sp. 179-BFC.A HS]|uniref:CotO family spore coat protein n=1 Tax=Tigheibacillus jepli TaxID=3035914 RepID=A0ABU5CII4_9BACI|nr:CotO family spore coat protein [Virgibacillus sp. 179-BFC.A HS]MDY0406162.1 CotO family spore coat protein [Virgibacillus sp. 179-BFC.A HS]
MAKKRKFANNPLMYIQQPSIRQPEARMQHMYQSSRNKKNSQEKTVQANENTQKRNATKKFVSRAQQPEQSTAEKEPQADTEESNEPKQRTPFKEMTLEQKIARLATSATDFVPKMRCAVETEDKTYRGIIIEYKDGVVQMRVNRKSVNIPIDTIKDVRMLGF